MRQWTSHNGLFYYWLFTAVTVFAICCGGCHRHTTKEQGDATQRLSSGEIWNNGRPLDVLAAWYDVPDESLAKRRAGGEEFTAAHNRLPIGTFVNVTNLQNNRTVRGRITDRGIHDRRVKLDLSSKPPAGIVSKGLARVRMQVIMELTGVSSDASRSPSSP